MKNKLSLALISAIALSCSSLGTQFSKMEEATSGDTARVRIYANMLVKGIPNSDCIDWSKKGAGTIVGGIFGSSGYRGRHLDMPNPHFLPQKSSAEFYARADEPLTITLMNTPESSQSCSISVSFVPEKDHDYELIMATELKDQNTSRCSALLFDITEEEPQTIPLQRAAKCR